MQQVRYGVIGAGAIARYMARAFTEGRHAVATALADVNVEAARALAPELGAPRVVADYREVLADPEVDAVYLATPPFLHRSMTLAALRAGKHVCCEKPFMLNRAEVREVVAAQAEGPHLKVSCASARFHEPETARHTREAVARGALGELYRLWFEQVTPAPKPGATLPAWRNDAALNGGGIAYDWGPYDLDWMSFVLGECFRPRVVFGTWGHYFAPTPERGTPTPDVDGRVAAEIVCDGGLTIHWERRAAEHGPGRHHIELRGTRGGIDTCLVPLGDCQELRHHAYVGAEDLVTRRLPVAPPNWQDTMVFPIRDHSAAIVEDREPTSTPRHQLRIHAVLDAIAVSARTRTAVTLPD